MKRFCNCLEKLLYWLGMISVAVFCICTILQVISRLFNVQMSFTEELANTCLAWCCFIGGAAMIHTDEHFKFTALIEKLHGRNLFIDTLMCKLLVLFFNVVIAWYGVILVHQFWGWKMTTMPFSRGWSWLCMPIFGISGIIFSIESIINYLYHHDEQKIVNAVDEALKEAKS